MNASSAISCHLSVHDVTLGFDPRAQCQRSTFIGCSPATSPSIRDTELVDRLDTGSPPHTPSVHRWTSLVSFRMSLLTTRILMIVDLLKSEKFEQAVQCRRGSARHRDRVRTRQPTSCRNLTPIVTAASWAQPEAGKQL